MPDLFPPLDAVKALLARQSGAEVDFVMVRNRDEIDAIECKWDPSSLDPAPLMTFRSLLSKREELSADPIRRDLFPEKRFGGLEAQICTPSHLMKS